MSFEVALAMLALVGPALIGAGIFIGLTRASTRSAHKRIDTLEILLRDEFRSFRMELRESIENAWRNCPLTKERGSHD